jgi:Predicted phosphohydrolases
MFACASGSVSAQTAVPKSIINTFGKDPETGHCFTWYTSAAEKNGFVEYCIKDKFDGFGRSNILRVKATSYVSKNDQDTRVIYKAELKNLKPGTVYVYRVGYTNCYSAQGAFKTAEHALKSFTFINITDTQGVSVGDYAKWKNILDKALGRFPDARFLVHTGDMVDDGQRINQWDTFTRVVGSELMKLPIAPVVGNHEVLNKNSTNFNAKNFTDRFDLPVEQDTGAPDGTVYSFDYGNTHIAVMNTQCGSDNLKKQGNWLRNDMSKSNKTWKIVALHRGPYGATYNTTDIREAWTPIFDELGIDLVLQGHDHNYVRSYPMKNGAVVKSGKGTIYMVGNSGGVKFYPQKSRFWQAVDLQPKMKMYIAVTVSGSKMSMEAYDSNNTLRDAVTIQK